MRIINLAALRPTAYQKEALDITVKLRAEAPETYWVGGTVRDLLLSRKNFDIDIATSLHPQQVKNALESSGVRFFSSGEKFGTITALGRHGNIEITTFRSEANYDDLRHPEQLKFIDSPMQDMLRRDFTINALYFDPLSLEIFDWVNGIDDIRGRQIRFVGNPAERISEDPLRMLRAVRLAAVLDFKIVSADFLQIKKHATLINTVSGQRARAELDRILLSEKFVEGVRLLDSSGLLEQLLPELARLKKVKQSKNYHAEGNVFTHSILVLQKIGSEDLILRYAALFHDLGKFGTAQKTKREGRTHISFHGHAQNSAEIFRAIRKRIPFSRQETLKLHYLLAHHMDLHPSAQTKEQNLMRAAANPYFVDMIRLRIADSKGAVQTNAKGKPVKKNLSGLQKLILKAQRWQKSAESKIITGNDIMDILDIVSSKKVGKILEEVRLAQMRGEIKNREQGITFLKSLDNKKF